MKFKGQVEKDNRSRFLKRGFSQEFSNLKKILLNHRWETEGEGTIFKRDKQEKREMALTGILQQWGSQKESFHFCPTTENCKKYLSIKDTN